MINEKGCGRKGNPCKILVPITMQALDIFDCLVESCLLFFDKV